ncbi:MAG: DUF4230 domain-containing protein [Candidatus Hydrogenedentes bacterium]|nr:DUF4230 domain-containing protein [Candidatus Hydrogenedentota bacterium]
MGEQLPANPEEKPAPVAAQAAPEPTVTKVIVRTRAAAPWAIAAVLITGILVVGFLIYSVTYRLPHEAATVAVETVEDTVDKIAEIPQGIAAAFKPNVDVNTTIHRSIDELKKEAKLVVLTASVDVELSKTSEKRILWDMLQLGDTSVRLRVPGNKVQYYIPVAGLSQENFEYDPSTGSVCLHLPEPLLDREFVDVQSNPDTIEVETQVGWGRLDAFSGKFLEHEARRALRESVLDEGSSKLLADKARTEAESVVTALLSNLTTGLREDVAFRVTFDARGPGEGSTVDG